MEGFDERTTRDSKLRPKSSPRPGEAMSVDKLVTDQADIDGARMVQMISSRLK